MRKKLFTLSRSQREDMWRRFKQTDERQIAARLHAILLLDSGQNTEAVSTILHIHPKTLKQWVKTFVVGGEDALTTFTYAGGDGWLDADVRSTTEDCIWMREQFGHDYSDSGMRKLLKRLGYRYRQPDRQPAKADPPTASGIG